MESFQQRKYKLVQLSKPIGLTKTNKSIFFFRIIQQRSGIGILSFVMILSVVFFIGQQFILMDQQNSFSILLQSQSQEAQKIILDNLETLLADELALRNSRFTTNQPLYRCLFANPTPCDQSQSYDLLLYAPNPPIIFSGIWPSPPIDMGKLAGGLTTHKVFYTKSSSRCPDTTTTADTACPLQAIVQFKPLCGGTPSAPIPLMGFINNQETYLITDCPGRATGFDISIGVAIFRNGSLIYKNDTSKSGDTRVYRIKANSLIN